MLCKYLYVKWQRCSRTIATLLANLYQFYKILLTSKTFYLFNRLCAQAQRRRQKTISHASCPYWY